MDVEIELESQSEDLDELQLLLQEEVNQNKLVQYANDVYDKARNEREPYHNIWQDAERAFSCVPRDTDTSGNQIPDYRTKYCFPWAKDAADAEVAYYTRMLFPKDGHFFRLFTRYQQEGDAANKLADFIEYLLDTADFAATFEKMLYDVPKNGCPTLLLRWVETEKEAYQQLEDGTEIEISTPHYELKIERVPIEQFYFYPLSGPIDKAAKLRITSAYYSDLKDMAESGQVPYFNLDKLSAEDENTALQDGSPNAATDKADSSVFLTGDGILLYEVFFPRVRFDNGKEYKNLLVTMAPCKNVLIRAQEIEDPNDLGLIYSPICPDSNVNLARGTLYPGLDTLNAANFLEICKLEGMKALRSGQYTYLENFDPAAVTFGESGFWPVQDHDDIRPIPVDPTPATIQFQEIEKLKAEFESVTVPATIKGQQDMGQDSTATSVRFTNDNAAGKMHMRARQINEGILKPLIKWVMDGVIRYLPQSVEMQRQFIELCTDRFKTSIDPLLQQPISQELDVQQRLQVIQDVLALEHVDIQIVGYENNIRKEISKANAIELIGNVGGTPAEKYVNFKGAYEYVLSLDQLPPESFMLPKDQLLMAEQQEQQAAQDQAALAQAQQQAMQQAAQIEQQKALLDAQTKLLQVETNQEEARANYSLKALQLVLDAAAKGVDVKQAILGGKDVIDAFSLESTAPQDINSVQPA